ncbi:hypothetical protein BaRGS_00020223, partial [Batillaria attramentaria]
RDKTEITQLLRALSMASATSLDIGSFFFLIILAAVCAFPKNSADGSTVRRFESQHSQKPVVSSSEREFGNVTRKPLYFHRERAESSPADEQPYLDFVNEEDNDKAIVEFHCETAWNSSYWPFDGSPCNPKNWTGVASYDGEMYAEWGHCKERGSNETISGCYCRDAAATCCASLTSIPSFEKNILYVDFSNNSLDVLDDVTLENVTHVRWLILNWNRISSVSENAFESMRSLECLEIGHNDREALIEAQNLTAAVNKLPGLKSLTLNYTTFTQTPGFSDGKAYVLRHLNTSTLEYLFFAGGTMSSLTLSDLHKVPKLKHMSLRNNTIKEVHACSEDSFDDVTREEGGNDGDRTSGSFCRKFTMENFEFLDLGYNWIVQFPVFCYRYMNQSGSFEHAVLPRLTHLLVSVNAVIHPKPGQMRCLPGLQVLWMPGNPLRTIEARVFQGFPNLRELDLRYTNVLHIQAEAFNHSALRSLTIESSNWFFDTRQPEVYNMDPDLFVGSQLDTVVLSYNVFRYVGPERLEKLLRPLSGVRKLEMSEIGLDKIPEVITREFVNLKSLGVKSNVISGLPADAFRNLTELNHLDLSDNHLTVPDVDVLRTLNRSRPVYVNLARNPFSCACDLLPFLPLFKSNLNQTHGVHSNTTTAGLRFTGDPYKCHSPIHLADTLLKELVLTQQMCLLSVEQEILICTVCLIVIGGIILYAILYRFRWQVRFWLYTLHVRWNRRQEGQGRRRARFNAFVSYCQNDSGFVLSEILPALEKGRNMPLCIHERDFVAGTYFSENIVEKMAESRHVLLVLSNAFLQDDWCRFEMFVAQRYGLIERRIPICIVMLEPLDLKLLEPSVILLLQSIPGLEWPGPDCNTRMREHFWRRLGQSLATGTRFGQSLAAGRRLGQSPGLGRRR